MKSIFKTCLLVVLLLSAGFVQAQTQKYGHIDANVLIEAMPETTAAYGTLEEQSAALQEQYNTMQKELNTKYTEYTNNFESNTDIVNETKLEELQDLQSRVESFNTSASTKMTNKQTELMTPIYAKATEAIETVAKEQGFVYVFDASALLYKSAESTDLLPLVKTKLGIE